MEQLIEVFNYLMQGSLTSKIRSVVGVAFLLTMARQYLKVRKSRKKISVDEDQKMIEDTYEKDKNGLYPWEVDKDDSPKRISSNAKRIVNDWAPKRGRWG